MKRKERIARALEGITRANGGRLTPELIVEAARPRRSVLHTEFDWSNESAAHKFRLEQARQLITYVTVRVTHRSAVYDAPVYVRDPAAQANEQGYVPLGARNIADARALIVAELDRCASCIERARSIAAALDQRHRGIQSELETMLTRLVAVQERLAA